MAGDAWLYWTDPHQLLFRGVVPFFSIEGQRAVWERRLRLWAAAGVERLSDFLPRLLIEDARRLLEGLADGQLSADRFLDALGPFRERAAALVEGRGGSRARIEYEAMGALFECLSLDAVEAAEMGVLGTSRVRAMALLGINDDESDEVDAAIVAEDRPLVAALRDICGHPFQPVAFDPVWRTSDVVLIARRAYDTRDFDALPILADALQDAGCTADELLAHLRDPKQVHYRGCWAIDLVLGKG